MFILYLIFAIFSVVFLSSEFKAEKVDFNPTLKIDTNDISSTCDHDAGSKFKSYFDDMKIIYNKHTDTCLKPHESCGWPNVRYSRPDLPLLILTIGVEGAGHHMWAENLSFLFDCVWITGPHYNRENGIKSFSIIELLY